VAQNTARPFKSVPRATPHKRRRSPRPDARLLRKEAPSEARVRLPRLLRTSTVRLVLSRRRRRDPGELEPLTRRDPGPIAPSSSNPGAASCTHPIVRQALIGSIETIGTSPMRARPLGRRPADECDRAACVGADAFVAETRAHSRRCGTAYLRRQTRVRWRRSRRRHRRLIRAKNGPSSYRTGACRRLRCERLDRHRCRARSRRIRRRCPHRSAVRRGTPSRRSNRR